jgi:rare lipoprotein A
MQYGIKLGVGASALLMLSSCGSFDGKRDVGINQAPPAIDAPAVGVSDVPVKIGSPYQVGSTTYTPSDVAAYDEVGYASWYGSELQGQNTANGEIFMPMAVSAAHKTLPMPSYVEITSLETGRTILARVNDRGPFANDRLIDLSEGAAKQLGITGQGVAGVRVRKVNPPEQDRAMLRSAQSAPARMDTPESLLKILREKLSKQPKPVARPTAARPVATTPAPARPAPAAQTTRPAPQPAATGDGRFVREGASAPRAATSPRSASAPAAAAAGYVVQIAAYSSRARADDLARRLGASVATSADGSVHRVRFGPFASEGEGQRALADAQKRGYPQARLYRE